MRIIKPLLTALILFCFATTYAQTADEIINKYIAANGGMETWKKITSIRQEGVINNNGVDIGITMVAVQNKGSRTTISVAGMSGYSITTPTNGWYFFPWQGHMKPEAMTPEDVQQGQDDIDIAGPLVDYKAKGHTVEYMGTDDFEGTDCYKVKLTEKSGKIITYFIDPSNYFIIHSETITKANGQESTVKTDYSNYQKLPEGIWLPMTMINGSTIKVKKVEVNPVIEDSLFTPGSGQ